LSSRGGRPEIRLFYQFLMTNNYRVFAEWQYAEDNRSPLTIVCPNAIMSTINSTALGLNAGLRYEKQETNRLRFGTALPLD